MLRLYTLTTCAGLLLLVQVAGGRAWSQEDRVAAEQIFQRALQLQQAGDLEGAIDQYHALLALHPDVAEVRFNLGNAYASMGNYGDAIIQYEQAIESGGLPEPPTARHALGWTYFQAGEFEKARDLSTDIVKERPENREALRLLASCYFRLGQWQKVIELVSPLESELRESSDLGYLLGAALVEDGQVERGAPLLESALQHTDSAEGRFNLGRALMGRHDYIGAAKHLERAIALDPRIPSLNATYGKLLRIMIRHDEANEAFLRELERDPDNYDANLFHGAYLYENEQKYDEALACFERALRARPGDRAARFQIGLVYNDSNRIEKALETVKGVVDEHPDFLDGQITLTGLYYRLGREEDAARHRAIAERLRTSRDGEHLIRLGQTSQAVELFERQKKADPSDPQPYYNVGMALALSQEQDWHGAVAEFKEASRLDPDNLRYAVSHANALARTGEHELARAALKSIGKAVSQQLDPQLAWLLGDTHYQLGEYDQTLQVLDFLADQDPENPQVDLLRGQISVGKGEYESARVSAEASIEKQPNNNGLAYFLLGTARYQLGDKPGAKKAFLKAVDQDPTNADHLRRLGALFLELGDYEQAIKYLERAKVGADDFPDVPRLLERAYQAQEKAVATPLGSPQQPRPAIPVPARESRGMQADELVEEGKAALARGKVPEALRLFEEAVKVEPQHWVARSYLTDIYLAQDRLGLAYVHLSEMEKIDPQSATGLPLMAQYWYQQRDYGQALEYGVRAKEVDPSSADLRNLLGNLYFSRGQTQQAVEEYRAAVELDPERTEFKMNLEVARKKLR